MNTQQLLSLILLSAQLHPATLLASSRVRSYTGKLPTAVSTSTPLPVARSHEKTRQPAARILLEKPTTLIGQSSTLLPDGETLLLGGENGGSWTSNAEIRAHTSDPASLLDAHLERPRAFHTATLLPNGRVLIQGGLDVDGMVTQEESFHPVKRQFSAYRTGLLARAHHTATVLTNGSLLVVGGVDEHGAFLDRIELWDYRTLAIQTVEASLTYHRMDARAILEADGRVRIHGGTDESGTVVTADELFDPATQSMSLAAGEASSADNTEPAVVASVPTQNDASVRIDAQISVRFSSVAAVETINSSTAHLTASDGANVAISIVPAEKGRLAFFTPKSTLSSNTTYTLTLQGVRTAEGTRFPSYQLNFQTAAPAASVAASQGTSTVPASAQTARAQNVTPKEDGDPTLLQAAPGVTALSGLTKTIFGKYLPNITFNLDCDGKKATGISDSQGRFLIVSEASGHCEMEIDGTTAHEGDRDFGRFFPGVDLVAGQTNILPYTVWMTPIDHAHEITIPSPTVGEVVITHPNLKGLELHLPARTVIRDFDGQVVTKLGITPIPIRRPPFPLPQGVAVPIYFTIQPGGAFVEVGGSRYGTGKGAQLIYPNKHRAPAGTPFNFWDYDPDGRNWYVYGKGHVDKNRRSIVPDPGVVIHRFTGAMVAEPIIAPPLGPNPPYCISLFGFTFCLPGFGHSGSPLGGRPGAAGAPGSMGGMGSAGSGGGWDPAGNGPDGPAGDPVDPSTGLFVYRSVDYVIPDVIPFQLQRTYRQGDSLSRSFGVGTSSDLDVFIVGDTNPYTYQDLILPDGSRVHFTRTSAGTGFVDAVYATSVHAGAFVGSAISYDQFGWKLSLRNGAIWHFPDAESSMNPMAAAISTIQDRYGNALTIIRDPVTHEATRVTSQNGRFLALTWDSSGRIVEAQDNLSRTTSYVYDSGGRLAQVTNPAGGVTRYTYDANDQMLTITDPRGNVMLTNAYDAEGRVQQQTLADGSSLSFSYTEDVNGNIIQTDVTNPRGNVRRMFFNASSYFSGGQMTSEIHALGKPEQQTRQYSWNSSTGLLQSETDALNRTATYSYDSAGNTIQVILLQGTASQVSVSATYESTFNNLLSVTDTLNRTTQLSYDSFGNLTKTTSPAGVVWNQTYNSNGQLLSASNSIAGTIQFEYSAGLLSGSRDALGNRSVRLLDPIGRLIQTTDPLGNIARLEYDDYNRIIKTTDSLGGVTQFAWDPNSNLLSLVDANSNATSFTYDNRDHQVSQTDPLHHTTGALYNQNGNLLTVTDRKGQVTKTSYDNLDRVTQITYSDNTTTSFTYDAGNRVTQITDSSAGTISRTFDSMDRLLSETGAEGTVTYTYDSAGERTSMTAGNQATVSYFYDLDGHLSQITQSGNTILFTYDSAGRRSTSELPNSISVAYQYDGDSRLAEIDYAQGSNSLGNLTYTYDAAGRKTLVGGSLARTALPQALSSASYNSANELTAWGSASFSYDANGNMLTDGANTLVWNSRDQLTSISGSAFASFAYDAVGRRRVKAVNSSQEELLFDGNSVVQEQGPDGSIIGNTLIGLGTDQDLLRTDSSGTSAFLSDALGSTIELIASDGTLRAQYTYQAFGGTSVSGASSNFKQFTGQDNDSTGLYYFRARYYSPLFQRFISQDPTGFNGGINLYAYAADNPVSLSDPSGLKPGDQTGPTSNSCSSALSSSNRSVSAVARADAAWNVLQAAANANGIPTSLLAAIAIRESNFTNVQETLQGGGAGPGMGVFQLTNQPGVSAQQAFNLPFAANYAAHMLASNMNYLSEAYSFTPSQLLQATAASYNFGVGNISGNPNTIDVGSTGGNYGSSVISMMNCF